MINFETLNWILSIGTILTQVVTVVLLALYFLDNTFPDLKDISKLIGRWGMWKGFTVSVLGTLLTLYYSEILGFAPCGLCWLQRIFLYPQIILFGIALWKRDRGIADYSIGLSSAGLCVALYQHYLQMGGTSLLPCPANPGATDCAQRIIFEFGYITFPLMAATLFAFLIVMMLFVRQVNKK